VRLSRLSRVSTKRIENDEGAWQGSAVCLLQPDGTIYEAPLVMTGEGAYEGLTAIVDPVGGRGELHRRWLQHRRHHSGAPVPQTGQ
jgi:hypothetical protein